MRQAPNFRSFPLLRLLRREKAGVPSTPAFRDTPPLFLLQHTLALFSSKVFRVGAWGVGLLVLLGLPLFTGACRSPSPCLISADATALLTCDEASLPDVAASEGANVERPPSQDGRPESPSEAHEAPEALFETTLEPPRPDGQAREIELLDHRSWLPVARQDDPFAPLFPKAAAIDDCTTFGIATADQVLEIDTEVCTYVTVRHPIAAAIPKGGRLRLYFYHVRLDAEAPSEAVLVLSALGTTFFEKRLAIPAPPAVYEPVFSSPLDLPKGTPLVVHLHNHGANHYLILSLALLPP